MDINRLKTSTEIADYLERFIQSRQKAYELHNRLNEPRKATIQCLRYKIGLMREMSLSATLTELKRCRKEILSICRWGGKTYMQWEQFFQS